MLHALKLGEQIDINNNDGGFAETYSVSGFVLRREKTQDGGAVNW